MLKRHPQEMLDQGFIIDTTCYPWVAYKGPRFAPDEWHRCYTDTESALLKAAEKATLYKIRYIVQETKRGRDRRCVDVKRIDEKVIYGNLARAKEIYQEYLNDAQGFEQYSKYSVILELFIPLIHENGELAYWPDGGSYIEQHRTRLFRG